MSAVRIVEVGPRDGLQNVKPTIPTSTKLALIRKLHAAGLQTVEITSVVSPQAVPQLADCKTILADSTVQSLIADPSLRTPVLIPNLKGLDIALSNKVREVAVFVSAAEGFSRANIRCSVQEGIDRARQVAEKARAHGVALRGYISCIFACPFDGSTPHAAVLDCTRQLLDMGCYEVSLGDTVGVGVPADTEKLVRYLVDAGIPVAQLAGHFHDTYGQAVANVWAAYGLGMRAFDSSVGGLGGCPYAPGAKGNVATEDLVYSLHQAGIQTGVKLPELVKIGQWITNELAIPNSSRAGAALFSKSQRSATQPTPKPLASSLQWTQQPSAEGLQIHRSGANLKLTLDRPRNGNALTESMITQLTKVFEDAATDTTSTRIALTANGKFFCTGMDLGKGSSPVAQSSSASDAQFARLFRLFEAIDRAPQVTVACIQGSAFGGGVGLALVCDIRIMVKDASVRMSEVRLGLAPATVSKYVIRELGISLAREAMLTARPILAQELHRLGKVAQVIESTEQAPVALDAYLIGLRAAAPHASTLTKDMVRLAYADAGGKQQAAGVKAVFSEMMAPQSESTFGLQQFQSGVKEVDWDAYKTTQMPAKAKL
ncbi:putative secondary metabolism biosynthetic enzyme [Elasticomyces elasticus]|uniref:hydroxymethylglutaryl-CoA lyase n=1 Tax=Elasticomyces elasticus TaxID=574655 RepID=A0AAN7W7S1_9PEZI|nr:putative secondary metabolism biosynthetic enzyme [Elasticomyces elasticus]